MRIAALALIVLVLAACGGPRVRHDAADAFDPTAHQTFRIADTDAVRAQHPAIYSELVDERVREALVAELEELGYRRVEAGAAADLELVVRIQLRSRLKSSGGGVGFGFGIGATSGHSRSGVGVGVGSGRPAEEEILVDLVVEVHAVGGGLLWQGVAEDGLSEYRRRSAGEVRQVVARLFDQPPFARLQP